MHTVTRKSKHILVVEDDMFLAEMMGKTLQNQVMRVTIVNNGKQALEAMRKEVPDLVLLDLLMPVLDGHGVLQGMKQNKIRCPVVILSNISDKMTRAKCKEMGVKDYFVKSDMDDDNLWQAVEGFIA